MCPDKKAEPAAGPGAAHLDSRRGWGVFTIKVPADFGDRKLIVDGQRHGLNASVPMHLDPHWLIEPFEDAASKNRLPYTARVRRPAVPGPPSASRRRSPRLPASRCCSRCTRRT